MKPTFCFVSRSPRVSFAALQKIARAVSRQLIEDVAPAWRVAVPSVVAATSTVTSPHDAVVFSFLENDPATPDAGGWHTEDETGRIFAEVLISPYLDHGGTLFDGPESIAAVASHEVIETVLDPFCVLYAMGPDQRLYPVEGCDAVQGYSYPKGNVTVSDFLLPAFFDSASKEPGDFLKKGAGPFKTAPAGYQAILDPGNLSDATEYGKRLDAYHAAVPVSRAMLLHDLAKDRLEHGADVPAWLLEHKLLHGTRIQKRLRAEVSP